MVAALTAAVAVGALSVPPAVADSSPLLSLGSVQGTFYANPTNSGAFDVAQLAHPLFRDSYSRIAFNPASPSQVNCANNLAVNDQTRPFTDVERMLSGSCIGTPAQGNGLRAGVGSLGWFEASFLSSLQVSKPGNITLQVTSDDGWILGLGAGPGGSQPTYVHGASTNAPGSSPVKGYRVVGADNEPNSPTADSVTVAFPAAGSYPLELDYTECCGGSLTLVLGTSTQTPIPGTTGAALHLSNRLGGGNPSSIFPCSCHGDPVDSAAGNFSETVTDAALAGRGPAVSWDRTYSSQDTLTDGPLGVGWSSPYLMHVDVDPDTGQATVVQENGSTVDFAPTGAGYEAPSWVLATLVRDRDGTWTFTRDARTTFTFDGQGRLTAISDLNGETTRLRRDASGALAAVVDPAGRVLSVTTDSSGRVVAVTDAMGRVTRYVYNDAGDLVTVTNPAGGVTRYGYDVVHRLTSMTDPTGATTTNSYDSSGRVIAQTDPTGATTTFDYADDDPPHSTTTITDPTEMVTVETYADYLPVSVTVGVTSASPAIWTYTIDPTTLGPASIIDPDGRNTTFKYDARGNLVSTAAPSGATTAATYDALNDVVSTTDATGVTGRSTYDSRGNLTSTSTSTAAGAAITTFSHADPAHPGDLTAVTDPNGHATGLRYTAAGLLASVTSALGRVTTYRYDVDGEQTAVTQPSGATTTTSYDALADPVVVTDATGQRTVGVYDADRRPVATTDAAGRTTRYRHDAVGRLVATTRPDGTALLDRYDQAGRLAAQSDAAGHTTQYRYDGLGLLATRTLPTGAVTTYRHDGAGQLVATVDALGRTTSYDYTADGYLAATRYSDPHTPDVRYGYDADGRRTSLTDSAGTTRYTYGPAGEPLSITNGAGATLGYAFDLAGQLINLTYPDGTQTRRGYDADGNQTSLTDGHGGTFTFTYTADGALASRSAPNGTRTGYRYDALEQVTGITVTRGRSPLMTLAYRRNTVGLVTGQKATGLVNPGPQQYGYNALDQLSSVSASQNGSGDTLRYGYDPAGNLTTVTGPGHHTATLRYTASGILASLTTANGPHVQTSVTFGYDVLGDRTSATTRGATVGYGYNQAGELTSYSGPADGLPVGIDNPTAPRQQPGARVRASYRYDGDGTRTGKTVGVATSSFVYDPTAKVPQLVAEYGGATFHRARRCAGSTHHGAAGCAPGTAETDYLYAPDGSPLEQINADGQCLYLHGDQLGSTRLVTDQRGHAVARFNYTPYGALSSRGTGRKAPVTNLLYTGGYRDSESGLYYLHARYYDTATAQFLTSDPAQPVTRQPFAYALDDPVNLADPTGLDTPCDLYMPAWQAMLEDYFTQVFQHDLPKIQKKIDARWYWIGPHKYSKGLRQALFRAAMLAFRNGAYILGDTYWGQIGDECAMERDVYYIQQADTMHDVLAQVLPGLTVWAGLEASINELISQGISKLRKKYVGF